MKVPAFLAALALMIGGPASATQQQIYGPAIAIDGDSLEVAGVAIRLHGIDAPEAGQSCTRDGKAWQCGQDATALLHDLVDGQAISCTATESDEYGRLLAKCDRNGLDLGLTMIEAGLALAQTDSAQDYIAAESIRKDNRIGIWASQFQIPAEWRAENPQASPISVKAAQPAARAERSFAGVRNDASSQRSYRNDFGCAIKGNRSRRGEWIYHLPGMIYYDQTRPEELFCTEAEARNAGYRRSKA